MPLRIDNLIRTTLSLGDSLTTSIQAVVGIKRFASQTPAGTATYAAATQHSAIVTYEERTIDTGGGRIVSIQAQVTILNPVTITSKDMCVLPNGREGKIYPSGLVDPLTSDAYFGSFLVGA
jgi:hypothetical protein